MASVAMTQSRHSLIASCPIPFLSKLVALTMRSTGVSDRIFIVAGMQIARVHRGI